MLRLNYLWHGIQPAEMAQKGLSDPNLAAITFSSVVTDSRDAGSGTLFVALPGEKTNGHNFLAQVATQGAQGAIVQRSEMEAWLALLATSERPWFVLDSAKTPEIPLEFCTPETFFLLCVDDSLKALHCLAQYHRQQITPTLIAVTGSVGKTSTKELVATVLQQRFLTLKNKRSFNSEITVPTTILEITPAHQVAVLELGMWAPGEIHFLASLAQPKIGIITNIGPSHLERMGSMEAITNAKAELVEALPTDGFALLNADDQRVASFAERTQAQVVRYGQNSTADVRAELIEQRGLAGIKFQVRCKNLFPQLQGETVYQLTVPFPGRHSVYTALAGITAGLVLGLGWAEIAAGLQDQTAENRIRVLQAGTAALPYTVIDDTYNASPVSTIAALDLLAELDGQRLVVLGDMLELGAVEEQAHRVVGQRAAEVAHKLLCVGPKARWIAEEAQACGFPAAQLTTVDHNSAAISALPNLLCPGAYVLVKGSRGAAMEQIVTALTT